MSRPKSKTFSPELERGCTKVVDDAKSVQPKPVTINLSHGLLQFQNYYLSNDSQVLIHVAIASARTGICCFLIG